MMFGNGESARLWNEAIMTLFKIQFGPKRNAVMCRLLVTKYYWVKDEMGKT